MPQSTFHSCITRPSYTPPRSDSSQPLSSSALLSPWPASGPSRSHVSFLLMFRNQLGSGSEARSQGQCYQQLLPQRTKRKISGFHS